MLKFYGVVEYISSTEALVTLRDAAGEWAGTGRVCCRRGGRSALYEEAYKVASQSASAKGGRLETFVAGKA